MTRTRIERRRWSPRGSLLFQGTCWLGFTTCLMLGNVSFSQDSSYVRPELLVEPSELAQTLQNDQLVVLDARSRQEFEKEHLPGARWVDHASWARSFQEGQDAEAWQERIRQLGIHQNSQIVVYDDSAMKDAARVWWILRYWGASDARLLNGGWKEWKGSDRPVTDGDSSTSITAGDFTVRPQASRLALKDQLLSALPGQTWQVVDARSFDEYCGVQALGNQRAGAIPGARHLEWSDLVDDQTHRFRSASELEKLFAEAKIDLTRPTATHCQSGGRSSVMAFGLELMGADEVRNYYRGWSEWGNTEETPVESVKDQANP
jgi:thiosulfate/3-mercaptopyruvate sulfurtransferase